MVDTGSNASIRLNRGTFDAIEGIGGITSIDREQVITLNGHVRRRFGKLSTFTLGDFALEGIHVGESSDDAIGLRYLSRYRIRLDTSRRLLFLDKGLDYAARRRITRLGFSCLRTNDRIEVFRVNRKSHAENAGLRKGDIVRKVDGAVATLSLIRRKKTEFGTLTLEIERGGAIVNITLTVTDDVDPLAPTTHERQGSAAPNRLDGELSNHNLVN
jgi:hypothetical protein